MSTITKRALREIIADTLREHRADAPGDCADAIIEVLHRFSPRSFIDEVVDTAGDDKLVNIAREIMLVAAVNVADWEVKHSYPRLTDEEVSDIMDLIGQSQVTVTF